MSSRKSQKDRLKLEEKKHRRRKQAVENYISHAPLLARVSARGDTKVVVSPPGVEKMSEVLEEFIEPYLEPTHDVIMVRRIMGVAALAWNAALLPEGERGETIARVISSSIPGATPDEQADFRAVFDEMIERKLKYFAGNDRAVLDFEVRDPGPGEELQISVVSTLSGVPRG